MNDFLKTLIATEHEALGTDPNLAYLQRRQREHRDRLVQAMLLVFVAISLVYSIWSFAAGEWAPGVTQGLIGLVMLGAVLWVRRRGPNPIVDGAVNLLGWITQKGHRMVSRLQTGMVQTYAAVMVFGVFVLIVLYTLAE